MYFEERTVGRDMSGQQTVPRWKLEAKLKDADGNVVADYTGANALYFPDCLLAIQADIRDGIIDDIANRVMAARAGIVQ